MTPATLLASARSLIEGDPDSAGLIDRFSIYNVTYPVSNDGGTTQTDGSPVASNVPGLIEAVRGGSITLAGGQVIEVSHKIFLIASATTRVVKPNYALVSAARSDSPSRRFEQPVLLEETLGPLVVIGATLKL
jgi:hypothetical protein